MHAKAEQHLKESREILPTVCGRRKERHLADCHDGNSFNEISNKPLSIRRRMRSLSADLIPRAAPATSLLKLEDNPIIVPRYGDFDNYGKSSITEKRRRLHKN